MSPSEEPIETTLLATTPVVLVVEDEMMIRLSVTTCLRDCGFKVVEAASAEEAQALILAGLNVDLIFSDINMSGLDGIALARWLAERNVGAPLVLTSGLASSLEAAQEACDNVSVFVSKPYAEARLVQQFRAILGQRD